MFWTILWFIMEEIPYIVFPDGSGNRGKMNVESGNFN